MLLWKNCHYAFNIIARRIAIVGRSCQVHLVDDDKEHFELVNRSVYEHTTLKKAKHVRDNICVHVIHTMATGALQLASSVKYEENGKTTNSAFDDVIKKIAFGNNTSAVPDLAGLMLGYDR